MSALYSKLYRFSPLLLLIAIIALSSCRKEGCSHTSALNYDPEATRNDGSCIYDSAILGQVLVDLPANIGIVRTRECALGNMVADAMYDYSREQSPVDFAMINGGNFRYDELKHPDGIYPAGDWTSEMVEELLPFGNTVVTLTVTGSDIKSICERSVSSLPLANGWFMHFSSQVVVEVDTLGSPQTIDDVSDPDNPTIEMQGERVLSIKINGTAINEQAEYRIITNSYLAAGGDGYVSLWNLPESNKTDHGVKTKTTLENYIKSYSPVSPQVEDRVVFK